MKGSNRNIGLFLSSGCLTFDASRAYLDESLSKDQMAEIRAHLDHCDFCRDAIEGLVEARKSVSINNVVDDLNTALLARSGERKQNQDVPPAVSRGTRYAWVSAAAAVIIIGLFSFYFWELNKLPFNDVAEGYVSVKKDQLDVFHLPEPQINMQTWQGEMIASDINTESQSDIPSYEDVSEDASQEPEQTYETDVVSREVVAAQADEIDNRMVPDEGNAYSQKKEIQANDSDHINRDEKLIALSQKTESSGSKPTSKSSSLAPTNISIMDENAAASSMNSGSFISEEINLGVVGPEPIYTIVEVMPQFRGGKEALNRYFKEAYQLPHSLQSADIDTSIYVEVVIDPIGNTRMISVKEGIDGKADREAVRVVRRMPAWEPGRHNGKKVAVRLTLAIPVKSKLKP